MKIFAKNREPVNRVFRVMNHSSWFAGWCRFVFLLHSTLAACR